MTNLNSLNDLNEISSEDIKTESSNVKIKFVPFINYPWKKEAHECISSAAICWQYTLYSEYCIKRIPSVQKQQNLLNRLLDSKAFRPNSLYPFSLEDTHLAPAIASAALCCTDSVF